MGARNARIAAVFVALVAWAGLLIQFDALVRRLDSVPVALWSMARYFTVWTNLGIAVAFTGAAAGIRAFGSPRLMAGLALSVLLVGVVYILLLRGILSLSGGDAVADLILHRVTPVLVPLFWLAFVPKGALRGSDPAVWILYPGAYIAYALLRGSADGQYPYPFLDVGRIGWPATIGNLAAIAIGYVAAAFGWVALDRRLGRDRGRPVIGE